MALLCAPFRRPFGNVFDAQAAWRVPLWPKIAERALLQQGGRCARRAGPLPTFTLGTWVGAEQHLRTYHWIFWGSTLYVPYMLSGLEPPAFSCRHLPLGFCCRNLQSRIQYFGSSAEGF